MRDGERNYFWGHYCDDARLAESDLKNRAEDYQRRYYVERIEQPPEQETYKYYSTQRPIDVGTYPNSRFNGVVEMTIYPERWRVEGEAFRAWGEIDYAQQLLPCEVADYELRPSRHNPDIRREMDAQAQIVGAWEDAKRVPEQKRLTWFYPDFGSYVSKEHITPEQLAAAARGVERQQASRAYKEGKRTISQQMQDAAKQAEVDRGKLPQRKTPLTGATDRRTFMDQERNPNKNAELSMEQNYNQIDGIINNLPVPPRSEKPLDKVREHPPKRRSREREER